MSILYRNKPLKRPLLRLVFEREDDDDRLRIRSVERVDGLLELRRAWSLDEREWAYDWFENCPDEIEGELPDSLSVEMVQRFVVIGRMWSETYSNCDGTDYDCGFTLEKIEGLQLIPEHLAEKS